MSEDRLKDAPHNRASRIKDAFEQWDAGVPTDSWDALDEALSVEKVWSRIDASIVAGEHAPGDWIRGSYNAWDPEIEADGWERLNDAISLENVWEELNTSLSAPVATRIPFIKLIAATAAMLFAVSTLNDMPVVSGPHDAAPATAGISKQYIRSSYHGIVDSFSNGPEAVKNEQAGPQHIVAAVPVISGSDPQELLMPDPSLPAQQAPEIVPGAPETQAAASSEEADNEPFSEVYLLERKPLNNPVALLMAGNWKRTERLSPWALQVGTQLSILEETDQSRLTTTLPKFGMAADLSFRHRTGPVQLIHALGMSQYSQGSGKYVNGRYRNTEQRLNTLQWSSAAGYNYRRFTVYGGVLFSRVLNGLEQNQSKVTKVYEFSSIQLGATGGIDMRILSFPHSGKAISVGIQYQWIPSPEGKSQSFENIQGIRLQGKFSF